VRLDLQRRRQQRRGHRRRHGHGHTDTDSDTDTDTDTEEFGCPLDAEIPTTCEETVDVPTAVGCEFYAADLDNWDNEGIGDDHNSDTRPYAITVGNPQLDNDAYVEIFHGSDPLTPIASFTVAADSTHTEELSGTSDSDIPCSDCPILAESIDYDTNLLPAAGFRITSDVPVVAYQWNPYNAGGAHTTDASLLLPSIHLDGDYIAAAWGGVGDPVYIPGQDVRSRVTIVATEDETCVQYKPTTITAPSFSDSIPMVDAGGISDCVMMDQYDVLQLSPQDFPLDDLGDPHEDLTGTIIVADKDIAVFGGHETAAIPADWACCLDHLEEQILPYKNWGTTTVMASLDARYTEDGEQNEVDPVYWMIVAGADEMEVHFQPDAPIGSSVSFETAGEIALFPVPAAADYLAKGTFMADDEPAPFLAVQFMTGAESVDSFFPGDPLMAVVPSVQQFVPRYAFVTDEGYWYDYIIVTRLAGTTVSLECMGGEIPDSYFEQVGSTDWEVARVYIDGADNSIGEDGCGPGGHLLTADLGVGVTVVGYAEKVSYGFPGGVCLAPINENPIPGGIE
jgi:hypothetical protein